jgi:putative DNA primase/helicase
MNSSDTLNPYVERAAVVAKLEDLRTMEKTASPDMRLEISYQIGRMVSILQRLDGAILSQPTVMEPYAVDISPAATYQEPDPIEEEALLQAERKLQEQIAERDRQEHLTLSCRDSTRDCRFTDIGNSRRFTIRYKDHARYCAPWKKWLIWDGVRWAIDDSDKIVALAKDTALRIADEGKITDDAEPIFRWAASSQSHPRINAMIALAHPELAILPNQVDANPHLLNFPNGTLDLNTLKFREEHRRDDFCTRVMGTGYDPTVTCPLWQDHLRTVFAGDETFIHSFQLMCGYSLLADNPEQVLFVLHGSGKNGKSVTVGALRKIWGDYSWNMAADTLMARKYSDSSAPRSDLAALQGVRLATASESDDGTRLSEATVKILTGGDDVMTVRRLYSEEFTFKPGAKVWLITNHLPTVRGTDEAIWRRIWLIPFNVTIPEEKRDPRMGERLQEEAPGILNWCLAGFREYIKAGKLVKPEIVAQATDAYREDQDVFGDFLADKCEIGREYECTSKDLFHAYLQWCEVNDEKAFGKRTFGIAMTERFGKATGARARAYHGVKLREQCPISKNAQIEPHDRIGPLVTDKTEFPEKSPQGKVETLSPFSVQSVSSVTKPEKSRSDLIKEYDLPADLDLKGYVRFTVKDARCLCKGCGAPAMWQGPDKALPRPLCDLHYKELTGGDPP